MSRLPTELWLHIASYCDPKDLWLSVRQVNRQLHECAEQQFERDFLSQVTLSLPVAIPTYDMRSQTRGKATFLQEKQDVTARTERVSYTLFETDPESYRNHFLARWRAMCESRPGGWLKESTPWQIGLGERMNSTRLKDARANATLDDTSDFVDVSFDWKPSMTSFFKGSPS